VVLLSKLPQATAGRMQENCRNGQEESDIVMTSEPCTLITLKQKLRIFLVSLILVRIHTKNDSLKLRT